MDACQKLLINIEDLLPGDFDLATKTLIVSVRNDGYYTEVAALNFRGTLMHYGWMKLATTTVWRLV